MFLGLFKQIEYFKAVFQALSMLKSVILAVFLVTFFVSSATGQQAANQFRRIDNSNGLSSNQINTIFSDSRGVIWIATVSGLDRYDGYSFRVFKNIPDDPTSLPENSIQRIFEDHRGYLWLFTTHSLYFYDPLTEQFSTDHFLFQKQKSLSRYNINTLRLDASNNLWIANGETGLYHINGQSEVFRHLRSGEHLPNGLTSNHILDVAFDSRGYAYALNACGIIDVVDPVALEVVERIDMLHLGKKEVDHELALFIDRDDDLWLYAERAVQGVVYMNRQTMQTTVFSARSQKNGLSSSLVSGMEEDNQGRIWIATDHGGINVIDKKRMTVDWITSVPGDETSLSANTVTALYKSPDNIIWVGTYKNGLNYYHEQLYQFKLFRSQPHETDTYFSNDVNCFAEDQLGNLWIGTNGEGLVYFDRARKLFKTYRHNPSNPSGLSSDIIVHLCVDYKNRLWIGTYQGGLNCFDGKRFQHYRNQPGNPASLSDNRVWQVFEDRNQRLWIGTLGGGLDLYDEETDAFVHHQTGDYNSVTSNFILALQQDRQGNLYVGTSDGLDVLDAQSGRFRHYGYQANDSKGLSHPSVLSVLEDSAGRLWVGTRKGLNLFHRDSSTFQVFGHEHGLPDNNIISMLEDEEGSVWIATLNGLSKLTVGEKGAVTFKNYDVLDGLQGREFNEHAALKTSTGELIFGGANGFNVFKPADLKEQQQCFPVVLTDFKLFNQSVKIGEEKNGHVILEKAISQAEAIRLKHNQNVFSIEFSALNYFQPERNRFQYMLEGFNDQWIETDARNRTATFTNLNPGSYLFRVRAAASDGSWAESETQLAVHVIPPFYVTPWALFVYFMLFVALILLLVFTIRRRAKTHYEREQEKSEYRRMRDLDAMKIRFFTNVSHEFRTPLTLILTPLDKILKEIKSDDLRRQLTIVQKNGRRLLNLVNQLLDFRKLEENTIGLHTTYGDIVLFMEEVFYSFTDLFESKHIHYRYSCNVKSYYVNFDYDKMEKILFNLLSNAVKFTGENGEIECRVSRKSIGDGGFEDYFEGAEYLEVQITDNGIGISPENHQKIFGRFFQVEESPSVTNQGSGIGLSLTREFVKMHKGTISVESEPGNGSRFTVRLPLSTQPLKQDMAVDLRNEATSVEQGIVSDYQTDNPDNGVPRPKVMIVEDNEDLRSYLKENLQKEHDVLEAPDGKAAWSLVLSDMPQLVVSDIMMPYMDGLELCRQIKGDSRTSHIVVILLTARSSGDQEIEGLEAGADDYLTKPFNYEVLELKIKRFIGLRESFRAAFSRKFEIKPGEIGITSLDEKFLKNALKLVEKNIGNSAFTVEKMGRELGISRGHLYNKLIALTGTTPVEFIRIMRLKRAAQLLAKSQMTVSEIAYQVGFNDPKYFTRYFKDEFGMVPSEFAKNPKGID